MRREKAKRWPDTVQINPEKIRDAFAEYYQDLYKEVTPSLLEEVDAVESEQQKTFDENNSALEPEGIQFTSIKEVS